MMQSPLPFFDYRMNSLAANLLLRRCRNSEVEVGEGEGAEA